MGFGTGIADEMGVRGFIDGTKLAGRLYGSEFLFLFMFRLKAFWADVLLWLGFGFVGMNEVVPVPEKWAGREVIDYYCYERPVMRK